MGFPEYGVGAKLQQSDVDRETRNR